MTDFKNIARRNLAKLVARRVYNNSVNGFDRHHDDPDNWAARDAVVPAIDSAVFNAAIVLTNSDTSSKYRITFNKLTTSDYRWLVSMYFGRFNNNDYNNRWIRKHLRDDLLKDFL